MSYSKEYLQLLDSRYLIMARTQKAALKGIEGGFLPEAAFITKGINVRSLFEEPYELMELDRLLAKPDMPFEVTLRLAQVCERLTRNVDKELALFGAESLNALEVRYVQSIQKLKKGEPSTSARPLAQAQLELALIYETRPALKRFYLAEAIGTLQNLWALSGRQKQDLALWVPLHLEAGLLQEAESSLREFLLETPQDSEVYFWLAKVKFAQRDYLEVMTILAFLQDHGSNSELQKAYRFWLGEDPGVA